MQRIREENKKLNMNKPSIKDFYKTLEVLEYIREEIKNGNLDGWGFNKEQLNHAIEITHAVKNIYYPL